MGEMNIRESVAEFCDSQEELGLCGRHDTSVVRVWVRVKVTYWDKGEALDCRAMVRCGDWRQAGAGRLLLTGVLCCSLLSRPCCQWAVSASSPTATNMRRPTDATSWASAPMCRFPRTCSLQVCAFPIRSAFSHLRIRSRLDLSLGFENMPVHCTLP